MGIYFILEHLKVADSTFYEIVDVTVGVPNYQNEYIMIIMGAYANTNLAKFQIGMELGAMQVNLNELIMATGSCDLDVWWKNYVTDISGKIFIVDEEKELLELTYFTEDDYEMMLEESNELVQRNFDSKEKFLFDVFFSRLYEEQDKMENNNVKKRKK